jgi:hypothetical protein
VAQALRLFVPLADVALELFELPAQGGPLAAHDGELLAQLRHVAQRLVALPGQGVPGEPLGLLRGPRALAGADPGPENAVPEVRPHAIAGDEVALHVHLAQQPARLLRRHPLALQDLDHQVVMAVALLGHQGRRQSLVDGGQAVL